MPRQAAATILERLASDQEAGAVLRAREEDEQDAESRGRRAEREQARRGAPPRREEEPVEQRSYAGEDERVARIEPPRRAPGYPPAAARRPPRSPPHPPAHTRDLARAVTSRSEIRPQESPLREAPVNPRRKRVAWSPGRARLRTVSHCSVRKMPSIALKGLSTSDLLTTSLIPPRSSQNAPHSLLARYVVARADKAEDLGDLLSSRQVLHGLGVLCGQLCIEELGEILRRSPVPLFLGLELAPYGGQLTGVEPEAPYSSGTRLPIPAS